VNLFRLWFSLDGRVTRKTYLLHGVFLMLLKYALDAAALRLADGRLLEPLEFLSPLLSTREHLLKNAHTEILVLMVAWALAFLWIGVAMSVRRSIDAGWSPWIGLLFVLPFINLLLIAVLVVAPTKPGRSWEHPSLETSHADQVKSALMGIALGVAIAVAMTGLSVLVLSEYGYALFFATPFFMGTAAAYAYNAQRPRTTASSIGVSVIAVLVAAGALLLFALEGVICLAMAMPIALVPAIFGALLGRSIALSGAKYAGVWPILVLLPLSTAMSAAVPNILQEREVQSAIEIDAPPERVWPHVIGFAELPPPPQLLFNLGVAYPMRAVIDGEGVGAVRNCEFSTGPFVEPITVWDPPRRLAFDVRSQPPPMHEWSPYRHVHAPHLDGYLESRRGEFRLIALPDGRTRLEGSTWYTLDLDPTRYWALWSDALIHLIHMRVLRHIEREVLSHASVQLGPTAPLGVAQGASG
jgi:uncharacterized membrane protein YhaH (DUF805 family)